MWGDISKASIWADADVYTAPLGTANPASALTAFSGSWDLVGLLDGDDGFTEGRNEDVNDFYAWGGILVATGRRHFRLQMGFTALENNDTTRDLIWPNSSGGYLVVPRPKKIKMAFELREDVDKVRRLITANYAEVTVNGDIKDSEADLTKYQLVASIFPDSSVSPARLFVEQIHEGS